MLRNIGKATKSTQRMPWCEQPMKDVANDDTPRGAEASRDPWDSEWGNPAVVMRCHLHLNKIGCRKVSQGTETS
jgi:hypothetical protein